MRFSFPGALLCQIILHRRILNYFRVFLQQYPFSSDFSLVLLTAQRIVSADRLSPAPHLHCFEFFLLAFIYDPCSVSSRGHKCSRRTFLSAFFFLSLLNIYIYFFFFDANSLILLLKALFAFDLFVFCLIFFFYLSTNRLIDLYFIYFLLIVIRHRSRTWTNAHSN